MAIVKKYVCGELQGKTVIRGRFQELDFDDERALARWIDAQCLAAGGPPFFQSVQRWAA